MKKNNNKLSGEYTKTFLFAIGALLLFVSLITNAQNFIFKSSFESILPVVYDSWDGWAGEALGPIGDDRLIEVVGQVFVVPDEQSDLRSFSFVLASDSQDTSGQSLFFSGMVMAWNGDRAVGPVLYESELAELPTNSELASEFQFLTDGLLLEPGGYYVAFINAGTELWDTNPTWSLVGYQPEDQIPGGGVWFNDIDNIPSLLTGSAWNGTYSSSDLVTTMTFMQPVLLRNLSLNNASLSPGFSPRQFAYSADVDISQSTTTVNATANNADATITINGQSVGSGQPSNPIALGDGVTLVEVGITSPDDGSTFVYTVEVNRDAFNVTVPDVVGIQQRTSQAILELQGLTVGTISAQASETIPAGEVINQDPVAGSKVPVASPVNLVVSFGFPEVIVPDVVGLSQALADTAIANASLALGTITGTQSPTVPVGDVISQSPLAGSMVQPGSTVNLDLSVGPSGIVVPNVTGLLLATAESDITNALLVVGEVTQGNSNSVPEGNVLTQDPPPGELAAANWPVSLVVSSGIGRLITYPGPGPIDTTVIDQLPIDPDTGNPIAIALDGVTLTIDLELKDPITGWAQCADWIISCSIADDDKNLDDCAFSVPSCVTAEPWMETETCCPAACYNQYRNERLLGTNTVDAFSNVYLNDASCYPGVTE